MLPHTHFLAGLLVGMFGWKLNFFSPFDVFMIAVIAVIIDIDHLISFYRKHKSWNLVKCWNLCIKEKEYNRTFIHHSFGFIIITVLLVLIAVYNMRVGLMLFAAYYSHILLDYLHLHILQKKHLFREFNIIIKIADYELFFDVLFLLLAGLVYVI